ncbi:hypothetical protein COCMIDRAFT_35195 [Bipolaris oryzae ATCC 44560]|uniref:Uncharacterized protein n=1 Tax=Bipolaris oryzae ATCC 44560 TaxID=930090 RepID=W6ZIJ0_COCMI|nr:uncharacterized protein COCMIDRAFT_35195 [Bipolaris oryzae ATCC 44560]EUC47194.1 hypothetical protein COCMIDRAFT_35195 [Bipolaris oryzae ATCC 44560]
MVDSSGGLPSFDNKAFRGLLVLMHPLNAFGYPHRRYSLPTSRERMTLPRNPREVSRSALELVSYSCVTSRMQKLRGVMSHPRLLSLGGRDTLCNTRKLSSAPSISPSGIEAIQLLTKRTFV